MNELDGGGDHSQTDGDGHTPFHPSASASTSPSASDVETSLTEDTGVTSSDADLYSPESRPKSAFSGGVIEGGGKSKSKQSQSRVRENEELESLLQ
jgi:hypothetical protein